MSEHTSPKIKKLRHFALSAAVLILPLLAGCGGSSDSTTASGGIGGTGATAGLVSDYGSIFVNGVEFDTGDAEIVVDGELVGSGDQAARSNLSIGQTVIVRGPLLNENAGSATRVDAYHYVQGPVAQIESVDDNTRRIVILRQNIFADRGTTLSGTTLGELTPDMVLRVSGVRDESGAIHAGLITVQPTEDPVSLKGTLGQLDLQQQTFMIGDQLIDYAQVQPVPDVSTMEDHPVSVTGTLLQTTLIADSISRFETETHDSLDEFGIDGFLQGPTGLNRWRLGPYRVELDTATLFEGVLAEDLTEGIRVQLQGELRNRVLYVDRARSANRVWLESRTASLDEGEGTIVLDGMAGLTIHTNDLTRYRGDAGQFSDLQVDDHVRVYAQALDDQSVIARFVFETVAPPLEDRFRIRGPVTGVSDPRFDILGIEIDTTANMGIAFYDPDGRSITQSEFINALGTGSNVQARGLWVDGFFVFEEMEIMR